MTPEPRAQPSLLLRSLVWQGVVLTAVITVFGAILHWRAHVALLARVDSVLVDRAHILAAATEFDAVKGWELELESEYLSDLAGAGWYELTSSDGHFALHSGPVPSDPIASSGFSEDGEFRQYVLLAPNGLSVRVGQSIASERAELRSLTLFTAVSGVLVLAAALAGGWWFASRALLPIERMSSTAESISERELSLRIDLARLPRELRTLGATLNAAFDRLEHAFDRQTRFTADASHEMRTPLAVLRTQMEHALRRDRTPGEYKETLEACLRSTLRMSRVVEQLLALASANAGETRVLRDRVSLEEVVQEALREAEREAESSSISLQRALVPVVVLGDSALLHEVVVNLVSNAIRYNRSGGFVRVVLRLAGDDAHLCVEDDGEGIPEEALPRVFERYFRVDPARSRQRGGAGLGLSIVQWIVAAHGGTIAISSRLGQGTTITIALPRASDVDGVDIVPELSMQVVQARA